MSAATVVLDIGSHCIKYGYGSASAPDVIPTIAGTHKYRRLYSATDHGIAASSGPQHDWVVGRAVRERRGLLRLSHPVRYGTVADWHALAALLAQSTPSSGTAARRAISYSSSTDASPMPASALPSAASTVYSIIEPPHASRRQRQRLAEMLLDNNYGSDDVAGGHTTVEGIFCGVAPLLALHSTGETTGVVLDVGHDVVSTAAAVDGYALTAAMQREDGGATGSTVTEHLSSLLRTYGRFDFPQHRADAAAGGDEVLRAARNPLAYGGSAALELVREAKEQHCTVSPTPLPVIGDVCPAAGDTPGIPASRASVDGALLKLGQYKDGAEYPCVQHRLPDGHMLALGYERVQAPEVLFNPALVGNEGRGLVQLITSTVELAEMELRPLLLQNVLLTGGTSLMQGLAPRLLSELLRSTPRDVRVRVVAPAERAYAAWLGAAFLSQLSTFTSNMVVSRAAYAEEGERVLQARLFA